MEQRLNRIAEMISSVVASQDLNPKPVLYELDILKQEIIDRLNQISYKENFENIENNTVELEERLTELQNTYTQNKIKLRLYQESLTLILPDL